MLFNKCIKQKTFPNCFKIAHVIPIPKVSCPKSVDNLRPISLLSAFAKIFEKILETKMTKSLDVKALHLLSLALQPIVSPN